MADELDQNPRVIRIRDYKTLLDCHDVSHTSLEGEYEKHRIRHEGAQSTTQHDRESLSELEKKVTGAEAVLRRLKREVVDAQNRCASSENAEGKALDEMNDAFKKLTVSAVSELRTDRTERRFVGE